MNPLSKTLAILLAASFLLLTTLAVIPEASATLPCTPVLPLYPAATCLVDESVAIYNQEYHVVTCDVIGGPFCDFDLCHNPAISCAFLGLA